MGCYVNPGGWPRQAQTAPTKEAWLAEHGTFVARPRWKDLPPGHLYVCWIENGWMTAAVIAYDEHEFKEVQAGIGPRDFAWYRCRTVDLVTVSTLQSNDWHWSHTPERAKEGVIEDDLAPT